MKAPAERSDRFPSVIAPHVPKLGILGGMGPAAAADFLLRVARLAGVKRDQDHHPVIMYSDPTTPDRSDAIVGAGPSPLPAMIRGVEFLNEAGCTVLAIPCNSAHYWYDELAASSAVPIVHIADAAAADLTAAAPTASRIGILATDGTIRSGLYAHRLDRFGLTTLDLADMGAENPAMQGIRSFKAGRTAEARDELRRGANALVQRGADALLLACTDISAALPDVDTVSGVPVLDASDCLARACLRALSAETAGGST